ncbi:hypothetical protein ACIPSA_25100 [Streptomyces sp. NPDC086549]|uniref:hypothetical protein n=1 Tax=Streptomyces sp. NPDC086549 TaxID=3365752 RepID=UPI003807836C
MPQAVLALGCAATTVSGCVWYLPALADLRAGADRPASRRSAAAACLSGWSTTGFIAVLLLLAETWWIPSAAAVLGGAATAGLRIRAAVQRRRERHEAARHWAELRHDQPVPDPGRARKVIAAVIGLGLTAAAVLAGLWAVVGSDDGTDWVAVSSVSSAIVGLSLTIAVAYMRRRRLSGPGQAM